MYSELVDKPSNTATSAKALILCAHDTRELYSKAAKKADRKRDIAGARNARAINTYFYYSERFQSFQQTA